MIERHKRIYRLVLIAKNRPITDIDKDQKICILDNRRINLIERLFARAERRHLGTTILSGYLIPKLQRIVNSK